VVEQVFGEKSEEGGKKKIVEWKIVIICEKISWRDRLQIPWEICLSILDWMKVDCWRLEGWDSVDLVRRVGESWQQMNAVSVQKEVRDAVKRAGKMAVWSWNLSKPLSSSELFNHLLSLYPRSSMIYSLQVASSSACSSFEPSANSHKKWSRWKEPPVEVWCIPSMWFYTDSSRFAALMTHKECIASAAGRNIWRCTSDKLFE
jgi:hypothetical protein